MKARVRSWIASLAVGLLALTPGVPPSAAAEEPSGPSGAGRGETAAAAVAQATGGQAPSATQVGAAAGETGLEWTRSFTGRLIPDPTGSRFFRPAVSGGTGVNPSW